MKEGLFKVALSCSYGVPGVPPTRWTWVIVRRFVISALDGRAIEADGPLDKVAPCTSKFDEKANICSFAEGGRPKRTQVSYLLFTT